MRPHRNQIQEHERRQARENVRHVAAANHQHELIDQHRDRDDVDDGGDRQLRQYGKREVRHSSAFVRLYCFVAPLCRVSLYGASPCRPMLLVY